MEWENCENLLVCQANSVLARRTREAAAALGWCKGAMPPRPLYKGRRYAYRVNPDRQDKASGSSVVESTLRSTMNERTCLTPGR